MSRLGTALRRRVREAALRRRAVSRRVAAGVRRARERRPRGRGRLEPLGRRALARAREQISTPRRRAAALAAVLGAVLVIAVLTTRDEDAAPVDPGGTEEAAVAGEDLAPEVARMLEEMSVRHKVAQLMLVGLEGTDADDPVLSTLERRGYAGVVIASHNHESANQVEELIDATRAAGRNAGPVAPWVLAEQDGGEFNAIRDLPPERAPAELATPREAGRVATDAAEALAEIGVTGVLGPAVDVGPEFGGAFEGLLYSDSPRRVRAYGLATLEALEAAGLFSAPKHFPGLGGASQSPELGTAKVGLSLEQLGERDLIPFVGMVEAGAPGIVVGHGLYAVDDFVTPASMSETIVTDLLRGQLGFGGVAIADDLTAPAITAAFTPPKAAVDAVRAGIDAVYVSFDDAQQQAVFDALLAAVRAERIPGERLDEAVARTLAAKDAAGLLDRTDRSGARQASRRPR